MTTPVRLRLSRAAGFRLQAHSLAVNGLPAVSVARPGRWGNPYQALRCWYHGGYAALGLPPFDAVTTADADREGARIAVGLFRHDWQTILASPSPTCRDQARRELAALRGKNLACWCAPAAPCHADALLELANGPICEETPDARP